MGKSFRIKSTPGKDQNISIQIDQDFEEIELLSLKIRQSEVYPKSCVIKTFFNGQANTSE